MDDQIIIDLQQAPALRLVRRDLDLFLILADGVELRIGVMAQYCDDAWLVVEQYRDGKMEWEQDIH